MKKSNNNDAQRVVIINDIHAPYHDKVAWACFLRVLKVIKPDKFIINGDFLDIYCLSRFSRGKPRQIENKRLSKEYEVGNVLLDQLDKILPIHCEKVYIEGNHENRVERYLDEFPQLEGVLDVPMNLRLKQRGYRHHKDQSHKEKVGDFLIIHSMYWSKNHASSAAIKCGTSIAYGHVHDYQVYTHHGLNKKIMGLAIPCMADFNSVALSYTGGLPTNWVHGFAIFDVKGEFTQPNVILIRKGRAIYNGKVY